MRGTYIRSLQATWTAAYMRNALIILPHGAWGSFRGEKKKKRRTRRRRRRKEQEEERWEKRNETGGWKRQIHFTSYTGLYENKKSEQEERQKAAYQLKHFYDCHDTPPSLLLLRKEWILIFLFSHVVLPYLRYIPSSKDRRKNPPSSLALSFSFANFSISKLLSRQPETSP